MNEKEHQTPQTVEQVFRDFEGRRCGIIKALTTDFHEFSRQCDPKIPNLCLYGLSNQQWQVHAPSSSELPDPKSGIISLRDNNINLKEWVTLIALHSDAWLLALASYFGAKSGFDNAQRKLLFSMISNLQTIHEVVRGEKPTVRKQPTKKVVRKDVYFPVELWAEIFSRVPVKSLMKFRCVCKMFCSIIYDPKFVSMHLNAYKDNSEACQLLVANSIFECEDKERFEMRHSHTFRSIVELDFPLGDGEYCEVVDCINGVVLVHKKYFDSGNPEDSVAVLWNPSIRRIFQVPSFPFSSIFNFRTTDFSMGTYNPGQHFKYLEVGFDASHCDPVVVAIFYPSVKESRVNGSRDLACVHANIPGSVEVYSYKANSWRSCDIHAPTWWYGGPQAFLNQAIHWLGVGNKEDSDSMICCFIISFDICDKVFHYIDLPEGPHEENHFFSDDSVPYIVDEKLALFDFCEHYTLIVWVMKEYGLPGSWVELYKFEMVFDYFLYLKNAKLLYLVVDEGVKRFDIEKQVTKHFHEITYCLQSDYKVCAYRESLLLSDMEEKH